MVLTVYVTVIAIILFHISSTPDRFRFYNLWYKLVPIIRTVLQVTGMKSTQHQGLEYLFQYVLLSLVVVLYVDQLLPLTAACVDDSILRIYIYIYVYVSMIADDVFRSCYTS